MDPRDRLQLILELTSNLLLGTDVYMFYDHILSTRECPKRAYQHLTVVASLANPPPMSQISELLGPGEGKDVEKLLMATMVCYESSYRQQSPCQYLSLFRS
jgi:hypothetical protein